MVLKKRLKSWTVAWIGSGSMGLQYIFCVFGSILNDFFDIRIIAVIGAAISTLGLYWSALVTDIKTYLLTYGLVFAIGQSLLLTSTLAILPHYFYKKISLANGIVNFIGACIVVLFPIFTEELLEKHGLVGTFYFLTALSFVTIIMGLTYKPQLPENSIEYVDSVWGLEIFKKKKYVVWCVASIFGM